MVEGTVLVIVLIISVVGSGVARDGGTWTLSTGVTVGVIDGVIALVFSGDLADMHPAQNTRPATSNVHNKRELFTFIDSTVLLRIC
ncbi:MAG: hypothetical protein Q7T80_01820 [Methanoregula sp.]|nr:hypothetical protein [Methanoregula sp.]